MIKAFPAVLVPVLMLAVMLAWMPPAASAQQADVRFGGMQQDTSAPVEVTADALSVNQTDGTALYTGNVVIIQGGGVRPSTK